MSLQGIFVGLFLTKVLCWTIGASSPMLPNEKCSLQDSKCLTEQAVLFMETFVKGLPDIGVESMDTIHVDLLEMKRNGLDFQLKNFDMEGLKNTVIDKISIDMDLKVMKLSFQVTVTINGEYKADGILLSFPVYGEGHTKIVVRKVQFEMLILFDIVKKDDNEVMDLKDYRFTSDNLGKTDFLFENAYNGDKNKYDKLHSFLDDNWRFVAGEFGKPIRELVIKRIFEAVKIYFGANNLKDIAMY